MSAVYFYNCVKESLFHQFCKCLKLPCIMHIFRSFSVSRYIQWPPTPFFQRLETFSYESDSTVLVVEDSCDIFLPMSTLGFVFAHRRNICLDSWITLLSVKHSVTDNKNPWNELKNISAYK